MAVILMPCKTEHWRHHYSLIIEIDMNDLLLDGVKVNRNKKMDNYKKIQLSRCYKSNTRPSQDRVAL